MGYRETLKVTTAFVLVSAFIAAAPHGANATTNLGSVAIGSLGAPGQAGLSVLSTISFDPINQTFGLGSTGFSTYVGTAITDTGFKLLANGNLQFPYSFTSSKGTFIGKTSVTTQAIAGAVTIDVFGTWKSDTGLTPTTVNAALIADFTESGPNGGVGNVISYGASFTTTLPAVPEPISLSLMGVGLAGLGIARRRKAAKPV